jgi:membrane protein implicated in regulation of membrane protease activity
VITSFRTSDAANSSGWWRALTAPFDTDQYTLSNYRFAWTGGMASAYLNSIAVTSPAVALPVLLAAFAAYALIFMRMPGAGVWYGLIVSLLIVPALAAAGAAATRVRPRDRWDLPGEDSGRSVAVLVGGVAQITSGTATGECAVLPAGGADDGVSWAWKVVDSGRGSGRGGDLSGGRPGAGRGGCSGQDHAGSRRGRPGGPAGAGDDAGREAGDGQRLAGRGDTAADD